MGVNTHTHTHTHTQMPVLDELEEGGPHGGHDIEAAHPQPEHKQEKGPVVAVSYTLYVSLVELSLV